MFVLSDTFTFPWPVSVLEPDPENAGKLLEHKFNARFELIDREEAIATDRARIEIVLRMAGENDPGKMQQLREQLVAHDQASICRVLRGWDEDLCDENEKPIPFNDKTVSAVLKHDRVHHALQRAYQEAISEDKARLGN
ncbi:hypothetical protein [Ensifer canadensis]